MKIERINENQIRCTLTSFDLSARNLNLRELAYGSKTVDLHVQRLRKKVGWEGQLRAVNKIGYRLEVPR